jgi:hypothetical protein
MPWFYSAKILVGAIGFESADNSIIEILGCDFVII